MNDNPSLYINIIFSELKININAKNVIKNHVNIHWIYYQIMNQYMININKIDNDLHQ